MLKFFRLPFATAGDKTAVPDAVDSNGNVSYSQGYGFDYQRQKTDPAAKNIERDKMNQVLFDITTAIAELQSKGGADFITSALNGGTAYSYGQGAIVNYGGAWYISLVAANTALPTDATKWAYLPTPALLQQAAFMSANAGGTVDAITAAFTPALAALPTAPGTLSVFVRATGANATTTPTFKADGTTAKTIVKGNSVPLVAGDIAGAGHWLELQYDATLDKWVLQNPTYNFGGTQPQFDNTTKTATTAFVQRALGNLRSETAVNTSTTLAAAAIGQLIVGGAGTYTTTLPLANSVPAGACVWFEGTTGISTWLVQRQGTDVIDNNGGGAFFGLGVGDTAILESNGAGTWRLIGGSVALRNAALFGASFSASGYQKLPSGLIIQWGSASIVGTAGSGWTYPIAFPNAFLSASVAIDDVADSSTAVIFYSGATPKTTGVARLTAAVTRTVRYIAIGY